MFSLRFSSGSLWAERPKKRGTILAKWQDIFSSLKRLYRLRYPFDIVFNSLKFFPRADKRLGCEPDHSLSTSSDFKSEWIFIRKPSSLSHIFKARTGAIFWTIFTSFFRRFITQYYQLSGTWFIFQYRGAQILQKSGSHHKILALRQVI